MTRQKSEACGASCTLPPVADVRRITSLAFALCAGVAACRCSPAPHGNVGPSTEGSVAIAPMKTAGPSASTSPAASDSAALDTDTGCPAALAETRRGGTRPGAYVAPTEAQRRAAHAAVAKLLRGESVGDVAAFGFEVVPLEGWGDAMLLREVADQRRGGGAYVVRKGGSSTLVVQAPHTFFDEGTFPLACELFQRTRARALFINTVHRYKAAPQTSDGKHPSDMAHAAASTFQSATEAAVEVVPRVSVVQLHGFADRQLGGRAVVSSGEKRGGSPHVARVARALEEIVGPRILKYPEDTSELGATTNVQGAIVRRAGGQFLHIEMADGLRRDLLRDAALRAKVLDALAAALAGP